MVREDNFSVGKNNIIKNKLFKKIKDNSNKKAINLWIVSDNLLKGAALNTVQIAQALIKKYIK